MKSRNRNAAITLIGIAVALWLAACAAPAPISPADSGQDEAASAPADQDSIFICDDEYPVDEPIKPGIQIEGLPLPDGFEDLPLNQARSIAFNFVRSDVAQVAAPLVQHCRYQNEFEQMGTLLGVVWQYAPAAVTGEDVGEPLVPYVISIDDSLERGYAWTHDEQFEFEMSNTELLPTEAADNATVIEPFMFNYDYPCFRQHDRLHCVRWGGQQLFAQLADGALPSVQQNELVRPIELARVLLEYQGFLVPGVEIRNIVSELENPATIQECIVGEDETCPADLVVAAVRANTADFAGNDRFPMGIAIVSNEIDYSSTIPQFDPLPPGLYIVEGPLEDIIANTGTLIFMRGIPLDIERVQLLFDEDFTAQFPWDDEGRLPPDESEFVAGILLGELNAFDEYEAEVPSTLAPYLLPEPFGVVYVSSICLANTCVWGQTAGARQ